MADKIIDMVSWIQDKRTTYEKAPTTIRFKDAMEAVLAHHAGGEVLPAGAAASLVNGVDHVLDTVEDLELRLALVAIDLGVQGDLNHPLNEAVDVCRQLINYLSPEK